MIKVVVFGCVLAAVACNLDKQGKTRCEQTVDCLAGYSCVAGECVMEVEGPDAGVDAATSPDAPPMCVPESAPYFCSRFGRTAAR